jgi:NAD(P)H-dependent FMN reductase
MKILAIGGSNSKNSINKALAYFTAQLFESANISNIDISQIEIPIYSIDKETEIGIPSEIIHFAKQIDETDLIVLSLAENNGSFNVGIKNLLDWTSRIKDRKTFNDRPMLLMATSPGARGGASVLESAKNLFRYAGADIKATFSLPEFYKNFDFEKGVINEDFLKQLKQLTNQIRNEIK